MMEIGYDAKKMPLGKLAKSTIDKGFTLLDLISKVVNGKEADKNG
jgi:poly [ADP-ribose] polymerase